MEIYRSGPGVWVLEKNSQLRLACVVSNTQVYRRSFEPLELTQLLADTGLELGQENVLDFFQARLREHFRKNEEPSPIGEEANLGLKVFLKDFPRGGPQYAHLQLNLVDDPNECLMEVLAGLASKSPTENTPNLGTGSTRAAPTAPQLAPKSRPPPRGIKLRKTDS